MTDPFAHRVTHLKEEGAYAVLARAQELEAQGRDIIHLEIGQPDVPTFPHISQRGSEAIGAGQTRYNPPMGVPELRQATPAARRNRFFFRFGALRSPPARSPAPDHLYLARQSYWLGDPPARPRAHRQ